MDGSLPPLPPGYAAGLNPGFPSPAGTLPPIQFGAGAFGGTPLRPHYPQGLPVPERTPGARFAPLSALPPEQRLPPRRGDAPFPTPLAEPQITPRERPGMGHANPAKQLTRIKQLGFNCPSCLAILIIKEPENYDGQAAPCPNCHVVILPPRVAPPTPFSVLEASAPPARPGLAHPVRAMLPPPQPPAPSVKPGLPGARRLARAALL